MGRPKAKRRNDCEHLVTEIISTPELKNKYAKLVCTQNDGCKKFLKWLPDPVVQERRKLFKEQMKKLVDLNPCPATAKQILLLMDYIKIDKLSPRQHMVGKSIVEKYKINLP